MEDTIFASGTFWLISLLVVTTVWIVLTLLRQSRIRKINTPTVVLALSVPKNNEKSPLSAEQLFASLHGLHRKHFQALTYGQVNISLEILAQKGAIRFYVTVPENQQKYICNQIYAQYPDVKIEPVDDYAKVYDLSVIEREAAGANIVLNRPFVYPIRTFQNFDVDPLASMTSALSNLDEGNEVWVQMVLRPVGNSWHARAHHFVGQLRNGKQGFLGSVLINLIREIVHIIFIGIPRALLFNKAGLESGPGSETKISDADSAALKLIEEKTTKLGFAVNLRILSIAPTREAATTHVQQFISTLQQFNQPNANGFRMGRRILSMGNFKEKYKNRRSKGSSIIMNTEELASFYHLPNQMVTTPTIVWSRARKGEPPPNLPITTPDGDNRNLTIFAKTDFRHEERKFGIKQLDRLRHTYVIGKTGMGKSTMLANMAIDDIRSGRGVAVIDPHGDLIETVLDYIPNKRVNDVVMFNPADRHFPVALNMLESVNDEFKGLVASGLIAVFYKMYENSWGPRMEHILRNSILALLDSPNSTLLGIPRMLVDKDYRNSVTRNITNPTVGMFWESEFPKIETSRTAAESLGAVQNKMGQFLSAPIVRNIVGQPKSTIDIRSIMDEGKILLVNLSKGLIGEDVSALMGAMMITKVQLAAMSRSDVPEEKRVPFYMYVDEFQNFATSSFATILSEARKYKLGLTMANQYISQMPEDVRAAVFGNVGTLITFSIGASDAPFIAKEFMPVFDDNDVIHLDKYNIYLRLTVDGRNTEPFSATTLPLPINKSNARDKILRVTRERYSKPVDKVEEKIEQMVGFHQLKQGESEKVAPDTKKIVAASLKPAVPAPATAKPAAVAVISPRASNPAMQGGNAKIPQPGATAIAIPNAPVTSPQSTPNPAPPANHQDNARASIAQAATQVAANQRERNRLNRNKPQPPPLGPKG